MLGEERSGLLPCIFGRLGVVAWPLVAEKTVRCFGIQLYLKVLLLVGQLGPDLRHMICRDQWILPAKKEIDRTADFACPSERTGTTHGDTTTIEGNGRLDIFVVMRRGKIGKAPPHAETGDANRASFEIALGLQVGDRRTDVLHNFWILESIHYTDRLLQITVGHNTFGFTMIQVWRNGHIAFLGDALG